MFLFDSIGFEGFKYFTISEDIGVIDKILYNVHNFRKKDKTITCITITFSVVNYRNLKKSELKKLTTTAKDLFHLLSEFPYFKGHEQDIKITCVDDQLQKFDTSSCGNYQIYFYKNLFEPKKDSKIINNTKLTKRTIETLLNEIFSLNLEENKERVSEFSDIFSLKHD